MQEMQSVTQFVSRLRLTRREVTMELILDTQPYMLYETIAMLTKYVNRISMLDIRDTLLRLYDFVRAHPFYEAWLEQALERYRSEAPIGGTDWGKLLIADALSGARQALEAMEEARDLLDGDEKIGARIVQKALEAPLFHIVTNAGLEGAVVINKVKESKVGVGFDAYNEEYVDMIQAGILDPVKVTRSALQNATSVSATLLTTESVVSTIKEPAPAMPAGADGGMGMM